MLMYVQLLCSSKNDRNNLTETDLIYSDKHTFQNTLRQSSVLEVSVSGHGVFVFESGPVHFLNLFPSLFLHLHQ